MTGQEKEIKVYKLERRNETLLLHLFTVDIIVYVENYQKKSPKKVELIREFIKVTGYRINIQKPITGLPWWCSG